MSLGAVVDGVSGLAGVDTAALSDAELHELVVGVQRERDRLAVVAARLLGAWDERRVWASNGSLNASQRLSVDTRSAPSTAKHELAAARHVQRVPQVAQAVLDGRLSLDHVQAFARVATPAREPWFERDAMSLIDQCGRLSFREGAKVVRYWADAVDSHTPDVQPEPEPPSTAFVSTTFEGNVVGDISLTPMDGAIVTGELHRLVDHLHSTSTDGVERSPSEWRALALVEMAIRSRTAPADGRRPAPLFTVHIGPEVFERLCELANGTVIGPDQLAPYLDTAVFETILFGPSTTLIAASSRRSFTGALRRAIIARDRHCTHPCGCDVPADRCDVDHTVPYAHGGVTDQFNGRLECRAHNRRPDLHDHHTSPRVGQHPTVLDLIRTKLAWQMRRQPPDDHDP